MLFSWLPCIPTPPHAGGRQQWLWVETVCTTPRGAVLFDHIPTLAPTYPGGWSFHFPSQVSEVFAPFKIIIYFQTGNCMSETRQQKCFHEKVNLPHDTGRDSGCVSEGREPRVEGGSTRKAAHPSGFVQCFSQSLRLLTIFFRTKCEKIRTVFQNGEQTISSETLDDASGLEFKAVLTGSWVDEKSPRRYFGLWNEDRFASKKI